MQSYEFIPSKRHNWGKMIQNRGKLVIMDALHETEYTAYRQKVSSVPLW